MLRVSDEPNLASLIDERERPMARGWIACERFSMWVFIAIVVVALTTPALIVLPRFLGLTTGLLLTVGGVFVVLWPLLWYQISFIPRQFARMSWLAAPDRIELRKGVWWRKVITVPKRNVQHTDVTQGPIQRRNRIASLVIHTAGTTHAKVEIPGLAHADASALRDWLIDAKRKQDAGS